MTLNVEEDSTDPHIVVYFERFSAVPGRFPKTFSIATHFLVIKTRQIR